MDKLRSDGGSHMGDAQGQFRKKKRIFKRTLYVEETAFESPGTMVGRPCFLKRHGVT